MGFGPDLLLRLKIVSSHSNMIKKLHWHNSRSKVTELLLLLLRCALHVFLFMNELACS